MLCRRCCAASQCPLAGTSLLMACGIRGKALEHRPGAVSLGSSCSFELSNLRRMPPDLDSCVQTANSDDCRLLPLLLHACVSALHTVALSFCMRVCDTTGIWMHVHVHVDILMYIYTRASMRFCPSCPHRPFSASHAPREHDPRPSLLHQCFIRSHVYARTYIDTHMCMSAAHTYRSVHEFICISIYMYAYRYALIFVSNFAVEVNIHTAYATGRVA